MQIHILRYSIFKLNVNVRKVEWNVRTVSCFKETLFRVYTFSESLYQLKFLKQQGICINLSE
jgi:hypothetical protein